MSEAAGGWGGGDVSFTYTNRSVPAGYKCGTCGATGCKLWREYQTSLEHQTLECCLCASKSQGKDVSGIDDAGTVEWNGQRIDQLGWRVPAVPTEDGNTYWGYSSVPQTGVSWWQALPTRPRSANGY